jgi:hypothetical protein
VRANYDIEIVSMRTIEGGVEVFARAWTKEGGQIGFGPDGTVDIERFQIINPPVLVADPAGSIVRTWTDNDTGRVKERRLREDAREALLQSLEHTLSVKKEKFGSTNIVPGKVGNTTSTFYPAAGANAPADGTTRQQNGDGSPNMATTPFTSVGSSADSPESFLGPSPATDYDAETLDVSDPDLGYDAEQFPYQQPPSTE